MNKTELLDSSGIISLVLDDRGNIVEFSKGLSSIYKISPSDIGRPINELEHFAVAANLILISAKKMTDATVPLLDGRIFLRRMSKIQLPTSTGTLATFIDISDAIELDLIPHSRQELIDEKRLRDAEVHKSAILNSALDCIITADVEGRIVEFNPAAEKTFGWSADEIRGRTLAQTIIPEAYREQHAQGMNEYLRTGDGKIIDKRIELTAVRKDGSEFPVEFAVSANFERDGTPFFTGYLRDISYRKRQEQTQRETEHFLRRTLDSLFAFVGVCHIDGTLIQANKPALDVAGLKEEDVIGRPFWDTYWWSYDTQVQNRLRQAVLEAADGRASRYDVDVRIGDGSLITIDFQLVPMLNEFDKIIALIPSGIDITDRKQAEKQLLDHQLQLISVLEESEATKAKLRVIFDQSWYFAGALDLDGNIVEVNRTALDQCGYSYEDVINLPFWNTGWWAGSADVQQEIREAFEKSLTGQSVRTELPFWLADGTERRVDFAMTPAFNEDGDVIFVIPTGADITDRKEAEAREKREAELDHFMSKASAVLFSSLEYDRALTKVSQLCVPTLADWAFVDRLKLDDSTERIAVAHSNPSHSELANQVAQYPAKRDWTDHPPASGLFGGVGILIPEFTDAMLKKAAQNPNHEKVMRAVDPKSFIVVPLMAREVSFGALTLIRCSNRRSFDEYDMRIAEQLAQRASIAIENARLYEEGRQGSIAKSEFIANMSHEIRTPMTSVLGYTDLLIAGEQDDSKLEFLETIKRNGTFLLDMINDILDLSKIESGMMDIYHEQVNLREVVNDVHSMMKGRADEKEIDFSVQFRPLAHELIESDSKRLRQILVNLLGNAIKFTETGSVQLLISQTLEQESVTVQFEVVDTGIGLTDLQKQKLFQPFVQGDASVTRAFGGSGLGLAISRRLAKLLGGDIEAKSSLGKGSTFVCTISAGISHSIPNDSSQPSKVFGQAQPDASHKENANIDCNVLVVDDRRDVRFLAGHLLRKFGASVEFCEDGLEAVNFVENSLDGSAPDVDIVFLDMQMPRLSGYEAAKQIRKLGFKKPVIALTADAMHGDMNRCLENGCDAYLSKPIDSDELYKMLVRFVGRD